MKLIINRTSTSHLNPVGQSRRTPSFTVIPPVMPSKRGLTPTSTHGYPQNLWTTLIFHNFTMSSLVTMISSLINERQKQLYSTRTKDNKKDIITGFIKDIIKTPHRISE